MTTIIHDPKNEHPIEKLYVWLSQDEDRNEGIIDVPTKGDGMYPLICSNLSPESFLAEVKDIAKQISALAKKKIIMAEFVRKK